MKTRKIFLAIIIFVLIMSSAQANSQKSSMTVDRLKSYAMNMIHDRIISEQPSTATVKAEKLTTSTINQSIIAIEGVSKGTTKSNVSVIRKHPALGDGGNGYLLRGYEESDGVAPSTLFWNGSGDNGLNWTSCCWVTPNNLIYPSADHWGTGKIFYGTFIPPPSFENGAAFMLMQFLDPTDGDTWDGVWATWAPQGWHSMKMVEIAADSGRDAWNWGYQSAILSRTYPEDNLYDAAHIFYQINAIGYTMISYYDDIDSCKTTCADIDHPRSMAYSVYDRYDHLSDQYQLFVRQDHYGDWQLGSTAMEKNFIDSNQHIIYPVVAAHDNHVVIVAATYNDSTSDDKDIVCWFTNDGDLNHLNTMSIVAATGDPENYPEVSHVTDSTFVCTFVENHVLFASRTTNGGGLWSTPEQVSDGSHLVVEEYRTADIGDSGIRVIYEYMLSADPNIYLAIKRLDSLDTDGDGVLFFADNCPSIANSSQSDSDGDGTGGACDNCPSEVNPMQEDLDEDGIGDSCDACLDDPLNDVDGDGICGSVDNCPNTANPGQQDGDVDAVGDICDNCPAVLNPNQTDGDSDGIGDLCDNCTDKDDDGYGDPGYPLNSCPTDNCPSISNPDQLDSDSDGIGDACDCGDINGDDAINILDVAFLISYLYKGGPAPDPSDLGDINRDGNTNILDVGYLISYLYKGGPAPNCL